MKTGDVISRFIIAMPADAIFSVLIEIDKAEIVFCFCFLLYKALQLGKSGRNWARLDLVRARCGTGLIASPNAYGTI